MPDDAFSRSSTSSKACTRPFVHLLLVLALLAAALPAGAATYLPLTDRDLAARAPVIVRAAVVSEQSRLESVGGRLRPFTYVTLATLETIKGRIPESFAVRLGGGRVGDTVSWIPGTPPFSAGSEVVLFLERAPGHPGSYRLTEFGMSKFDLVGDGEGRRFAVRPAFGPREDLLAAGRADIEASLAEKAAVPARDAESFLAALRALAQRAEPGEIVWRQMHEKEHPPSRRPKWVNIGGREPGDCEGTPCLWRWFWDTGASSDGVVEVTGTQTNLSGDDAMGCGTDSLCDVQNGIDQWHGVEETDVRLSGPSAAGNIEVTLDATSSFDGGATWSTPLESCGGGVVGLGGPGFGTGPRSYRGDTSWYAPSSGEVSMRKITCSTGYSARTFKTAVMHEIGHVLGLGHPNQDVSVHSTTSGNDHERAVMHSSVPPSKPETLQADDLQAIRYLYTTGSFGPIPAADFEILEPPPAARSNTQFRDLSTNSPTSWSWNFGDPATGQANVSASNNPFHVFSAPGSFTVTLSTSNANGTGTISREITVAPPVPADRTVVPVGGQRVPQALPPRP